MISNAKFQRETAFAIAFARLFLRALKRNILSPGKELKDSILKLGRVAEGAEKNYELPELFEDLSNLCKSADKKIVLMIDEVDSAAAHPVFLDFLAQLRAYYIRRMIQPTFQSVILASVYDVKNLKRKIHSQAEQNGNSPWNVAADFKIEMGFSQEDIAGMLREYEADHPGGMDVRQMAGLLYEYTSGYPFLVSRLCKILDEEISGTKEFVSEKEIWTRNGFQEALRILLSEKNALFESLIGKRTDYPELNLMLCSLLFAGKSITYNPDESSLDVATMFGFIKNQQGTAVIANRIFETRLYNYYLSSAEMQR